MSTAERGINDALGGCIGVSDNEVEINSCFPATWHAAVGLFVISVQFHFFVRKSATEKTFLLSNLRMRNIVSIV